MEEMMETLKCAKCDYTADREEWIEREFACEDCGDHSGVECPKCEEEYDLVYSDIEVAE